MGQRKLLPAMGLALLTSVALFISGPLEAAPDSSARTAAQRMARANLAERPRPRVIVTSDVEIDDVASWHRFWLYANEVEVEGLIYTSSQFHWAGDSDAGIATHNWAGNDVLEQMLKGYGAFGAGGGYRAVYASLRRHDPNYPSPETLLSKVRLGNIANVGEMMKDTPGSELIKKALLSGRPGPLYLLAWGGTNTIAAALRSIEAQYKHTADWRRIYDKVTRTARLYIILDQDSTYKDYIAKNWPDLYTVINRDMFWSVAYPPFRNTRTPSAIDAAYFGSSFMQQIAQGPMLKTYPLIQAGGEQGPADAARIGWLVSEGDSPSYWYVLPTGLRSDEDPSFGGWGGRFKRVGKNLWTDRPEALGLPGDRVRDALAGANTTEQAEAAPLTRWIPALQNDFLARSRWTQYSPDTTNHEPVVRLTRAESNRRARAGQTVTLTGQAADPDGDRLRIRWWQYREAGTYTGVIASMPVGPRGIEAIGRFSTRLVVPSDAKPGDTIHIIAEVSDAGTPALTRYGRFVLRVQ